MNLNYHNYGKGHPLIILHGLFGSLDNWHSLSKVFAEHLNVFTIDQRNHGRSPHSEIFNYNVMAEDLKEFTKQHNLTSTYLLGHSMGGKTAMWFAVIYPEKVDKLIAVDITPKSYNAQHNEIFDALYSLDLKKISTRHEADKLLQEKIKDFATRQFLLKNLSRQEIAGFKWKINLDVIYKNYNEINKSLDKNRKFEKSTLFIRGEKSSYIKEDDITEIKEIFPQAKIVTVTNAGHWVHSDNPKEFTKVVLDFLTR